MSLLSSQHHSFDIAIAAKYGVEEAILIHHFMHWIRINQVAKRNIRDGKCWTYQSRKEICLHFPYWNYEKIRTLTEKLVSLGVLVTANYNKLKMDRTLWYAFANEKEFFVDPENSRKVYERENPLLPDNPHEIQEKFTKGKFPKWKGKIPTAVPDSLSSDTKEKERERESAAPPSVSADAATLSSFFLQKIKEENPRFKNPNLKSWERDMDLLLRVDHRDPEEAKELICWLRKDNFWKSNCLCPSKFREKYDQLILHKNSNQEKELAKKNKEWAIKLKGDMPEEFRDLKPDQDYARHSGKTEYVKYTLPEQTFRTVLVKLFGGTYEPKD